MDTTVSGPASSQGVEYSFAEYRLEAGGTLLRGETRLELQPQELVLLRLLLARTGEIVTPLELKRALGGDEAIPSDGVTKHIASLRTRLEPLECIQSIYKRGYRFSVPVHPGGQRHESALPRLAIMPFTAGYGVPEYLSHAVAEQAMEQLGDTRSMVATIVPRESVITLARRGMDARQIGKTLHADLVLNGFLHATPGHARLRAEMIRGQDGAPLWVEEVLVESGQIVELVSKFVYRIAHRLQGGAINISAVAETAAENETTPHRREAYVLYLRARYEWKTFERHRMQDGMARLLRAIELDPELLDARVELSHLCIMQAILGSLSPQLAAAMIRRATQGISDLHLAGRAEALVAALGWVSFFIDRNLPEALRAFDRSAQMPHDLWITPVRSGFALSRLRFNEAIDLLHEAIHRDPYVPWLHAKLAWSLHLAGEAEASVEQIRKAMEQFPEHDRIKLYAAEILSYNGEAASVLEMTKAVAARMAQYDFAAATYAYVLACAGRADEAHSILERLQWFSRERYVLNTFNTAVYVTLGENDAAINELRIANDNRCPWFFQLLADPRLKPLYGHPEFEAMRKILPAMEATVEEEEPQIDFYSESESTRRETPHRKAKGWRW
jgi:DNA-binding winged helix-turn-helix (wHTH) protein/tetratricopeptide (TPR) repeat protein